MLAQRWSTDKVKRAMSQQNNDGTRSGKDDPNKAEGTDKNPHGPRNLQHEVSKNLVTSGEAEKKKKLAPFPPTHTPGLDQKMSECIASPPHRLNREHQGIYILPIHESTPRTRLSFATSELANSPVNGNIASFNPFARNIGETVRTNILQKQLEDPGEGWTFQGKNKLPIRILSPR